MLNVALLARARSVFEQFVCNGAIVAKADIPK